jgi:hypothetical protein
LVAVFTFLELALTLSLSIQAQELKIQKLDPKTPARVLAQAIDGRDYVVSSGITPGGYVLGVNIVSAISTKKENSVNTLFIFDLRKAGMKDPAKFTEYKIEGLQNHPTDINLVVNPDKAHSANEYQLSFKEFAQIVNDAGEFEIIELTHILDVTVDSSKVIKVVLAKAPPSKTQ